MSSWKGLFKTANNELEGGARLEEENVSEPTIICKHCRNTIKRTNYLAYAGVCLKAIVLYLTDIALRRFKLGFRIWKSNPPCKQNLKRRLWES